MPAALSEIEERLINLFKEILDSLPVGRASLKIKHAPQIQHEGVSISLTPVTNSAAPIVADARDGWSIISLVFGRSTLVEVLPGDKLTQLDEVRAMCEAVIQGRFEEDLWLVGSEVTKCIGRIEIDGEGRVFRYFGRSFPFKKKERSNIKYSPY